jgi:hypothetical protein
MRKLPVICASELVIELVYSDDFGIVVSGGGD